MSQFHDENYTTCVLSVNSAAPQKNDLLSAADFVHYQEADIYKNKQSARNSWMKMKQMLCTVEFDW